MAALASLACLYLALTIALLVAGVWGCKKDDGKERPMTPDEESKMASVLPKGTVVHYGGIPCELLADTPCYSATFSANPPFAMKYFLRRKADGRFYRGARFWRWCRSWRHAALLDRPFWETFVLPRIKDDCELRTIEQVDTFM